MKQLTIVRTDDVALEMKVPGEKTERLEITSRYPHRWWAWQLFLDLGVMHMVAPYLPERIKTNFGISRIGANLIKQMYRSCHRPIPHIPDVQDMTFGMGTNPYADRAVVAHSAGKDSLWNMSWAMKDFGSENVMAVHIGGLNRTPASEERRWSQQQARKIGFPLRTIELRNSAGPAGYATMKSRDLFMAGILIPFAMKFSAGYIITEGFAEAKPDEPFSGQAKTMQLFNDSLAQWGLPVRVIWRDKPEMDIIREMYEKRPDWMKLIFNCFTPPYRRPGFRRSWERRAPTFPLYESQCGSCVKCRITNVGRILYDGTVQRRASQRDIRTYLKAAVKYTRERYDEMSDMLEGSFTRDLRIALDRYGLPAA